MSADRTIPAAPWMVRALRKAGYTWSQARRARYVPCSMRSTGGVAVYDGRITRYFPVNIVGRPKMEALR